MSEGSWSGSVLEGAKVVGAIKSEDPASEVDVIILWVSLQNGKLVSSSFDKYQ